MTAQAQCFVTGATGFLGRFVVKELLERGATIHALVRPASVERLAKIASDLGAADRVHPVPGDIGTDGLTEVPFDTPIDHLVHLAAIYDMDADAKALARANVDGTRRVLAFADAQRVGTFHMISSVAAAGTTTGVFTEDDPDHGQSFTHPYHRSKYDSEVLVRETSTMPYRVYRPGTVVGTTDTGETDKFDGAYALFPLVAALRTLPRHAVVPVPRFGRLPTVPVDRCAQAIAEIALRVDPQAGDTFGLTATEDERVHDVLADLCRITGGPRILPVLPEATGSLTFVAAQVLGQVPIAGELRDKVLHAAGIPAGLVDAAPFRCRFETTRTRAALAGSGIVIPPIRDYAKVLWDYWVAARKTGVA